MNFVSDEVSRIVGVVDICTSVSGFVSNDVSRIVGVVDICTSVSGFVSNEVSRIVGVVDICTSISETVAFLIPQKIAQIQRIFAVQMHGKTMLTYV
jgi:hypothetical protein